MESQSRFERVFSLEIYPPKTQDAVSRLELERRRLEALQPRYISVTSGAGGTARDGTYETVKQMRLDSTTDIAPHLTCVGVSRGHMRALLSQYFDLGVRRIVAIRGDRPAAPTGPDDFHYASDLVAFIRAERKGDRFHVEVAAYPEFHSEAASARADLEHFKRKVDAGADSATTQFFYNPDAYFRFVDACEGLGVDVPVVPGIMPITSYERLVRLSDAMGVEIPRWLRRTLEGFGDDTASLRAFGVDAVTRLCRTLLDGGAPGLHFYTMNAAEPTTTIWRNLGLFTSDLQR